MLFYDVTFSHKGELKLSVESTYLRVGNADETVKAIFTIYSKMCTRKPFKKTIAVIHKYDENELHLLVGLWQARYCLDEVCDWFKKTVEELTEGFEVEKTEAREISFKVASAFIETAYDRDYMNAGMRQISGPYGLSIYDSCAFEVTEEIVRSSEYSHAKAIEEADLILSSDSFKEEIERIYAPSNLKGFYGCPVHYRIQTKGKDSALEMIRVLIKSLYENKRLLSARYTLIENFSSSNTWCDEIGNIGNHSEGACVVISSLMTEESAQYASYFENTAEMVKRFFKLYGRSVQIFVIEDENNPGFSKSIFKELIGEISFVTVSEGVGDLDLSKKYMEKLAGISRYKNFFDKEAYKYLPDRKYMTSSMVNAAFSEWEKDVLKKKAYTSYSAFERPVIRTKKKNPDRAYDELMEMVGLDEAKKLIQQIIASYKLSKYKSIYDIEEGSICRHMVFTGNPGCAKTTAARLLCDILQKEEVLKTGKFVECGRSDLVGRYVGWTAKEVKAKFREAYGGILFIDEAYSLVDDSNSFGTEAINTIVQEMENARDRVIVIFAGYPQPMERFIEQNEGLRSRIAFHINFPDYTSDELMQIMDLMLKKRGLEMDLSARHECMGIFEMAQNVPNSGNGRFVRNILEQATLKQAMRLLPPGSRKKPSKREIKMLRKEDFDINISKMLKEENRQKIGFVNNL